MTDEENKYKKYPCDLCGKNDSIGLIQTIPRIQLRMIENAKKGLSNKDAFLLVRDWNEEWIKKRKRL